MKNRLLYSIFILLFLSCNPDPQFLLQELIVGSWKDQGIYKIYSQNGTVIDSVYTKDIFYTFRSDGTYSIENEILVGIPSPGHYTIDSNNSRIDFKYNRSILDTPVIYQAYTWQINNFTQTTLDVNYNFKQSAFGSNPEIDITFHRKFIKL